MQSNEAHKMFWFSSANEVFVSTWNSVDDFYVGPFLAFTNSELAIRNIDFCSWLNSRMNVVKCSPCTVTKPNRMTPRIIFGFYFS